MKIKDILKEEPGGARLVNKRVDPETGAISHDVEYDNIYTLRKEVEQLNDAFKETIQDLPNDEQLYKLYTVYTKFKRAFKTHVNRKYGR
jgi:hypothetical protein